MTQRALTDKEQAEAMYAGGGLVSNEQLTKPMKVTEKHSDRHTAKQDTPCYDCGRIITQTTQMVISNVSISQGFNAQSFTYEIHPACYRILGQLIRIIPIEGAHLWGKGRASMRDLWKANIDRVEDANPALAAILERAFGRSP